MLTFFFAVFSHGRFHWRVLWMSFFMNSFSCIGSFASLATWFCIITLTVVSAITILNSRVNSFVNVATWWRRKACIAILPSFGFHSVWIFSRIQQAGDWLKHLSQYLHRWGFTSNRVVTKGRRPGISSGYSEHGPRQEPIVRSLIFTQTRGMLASEVLNHNDTWQMLKMLKGQSILIRCKSINMRCKINCKSSFSYM